MAKDIDFITLFYIGSLYESILFIQSILRSVRFKNALYELYVDSKLMKTKSSVDINNTKVELKLGLGNYE